MTKEKTNPMDYFKFILGLVVAFALMAAIYTPAFAAGTGLIRIRRASGSVPLTGATYNIIQDNGNNMPDNSDTLIGKSSESSAGVYTYSNLPDGTYYVAEAVAPTGVKATRDVYRVVMKNGEVAGTTLIAGSDLQARSAASSAQTTRRSGGLRGLFSGLTATARNNASSVGQAASPASRPAGVTIPDFFYQVMAIAEQTASGNETAKTAQAGVNAADANSASDTAAAQDGAYNGDEDVLNADSDEGTTADASDEAADSTPNTGVKVAVPVILIAIAGVCAAVYFRQKKKAAAPQF